MEVFENDNLQHWTNPYSIVFNRLRVNGKNGLKCIRIDGKRVENAFAKIYVFK